MRLVIAQNHSYENKLNMQIKEIVATLISIHSFVPFANIFMSLGGRYGGR